MTRKTTQSRKLMTLAGFYLLLATVIAQSSEDVPEVKAFAEYDISLSKDQPILRTNMPYAHRNIVVTKDVWNESGSTGFWIKLISPEPNSTSSECFQPFSPAARHSIKRISYDIVLFETMSVSIYKPVKRKLVLLNIKNCNTSVYDGPLSTDYKIFTSDNTSDESFTLIMNGKQFCRGHNWCRLFFNPVYHKFEPLNFHFPSTKYYNYKPATKFDGNLFAVEFLDETSNTYSIRLYNVSDNSASSDYKELLSLSNYVSSPFGWSQIDLISSSLSYCWRTKLDTDQDKIVHCIAFREDGSVVVNKTIVYSDVVKFYKMQSIPSGLMLIGKRECAYDSKCSEVQTTTITNDSCANSPCNSATEGNELITVRHRYYNFKCRSPFVAQIRFRVNVSIDTVAVDHICIYEKRTDYESSHTYVF